MNTFVPLVSSHSLETMMVWNTKLLIFDLCIIFILSHLLSHFDGTKIMLVASLVLLLSLIPCFQALPGASLSNILFVRFWIVFWAVVFLCPLNAWCKKCFTSNDQYLLVGLGNALGTTILGRLTPAICLLLWKETEIVWLPAVYLSIIVIMVIMVIMSLITEEKIRKHHTMQTFKPATL